MEDLLDNHENHPNQQKNNQKSHAMKCTTPSEFDFQVNGN